MHMVDLNDVIRPCFRGGQIGVDEYIVQKSRFRLHYERVERKNVKWSCKITLGEKNISK